MREARTEFYVTTPIETQQTCFACGSEHPHGLHLQFRNEQEGVVAAEWTPDSMWEGYRGIIHGGIVSTVLDEAMSKAVASTGKPGLTCRMEVRLHQSVVPAEHLIVRAWVTNRQKRRVEVRAELCDSSHVEKARATATFLIVRG